MVGIAAAVTGREGWAGLGTAKTMDSLDLRTWPLEAAEPLPMLNTLSLDSDFATPVLSAGDGTAWGNNNQATLRLRSIFTTSSYIHS